MTTKADQQQRVAAQITDAETKLKQLKARAQRLAQAASAGTAKQRRARETRQKILAGSMLLARAKKSAEANRAMLAQLDTYLTRPNDRQAFNLPPLASHQPSPPQAA